MSDARARPRGPEPALSSSAAAKPGKGARIWRRTCIGTLLAAGAALYLAATFYSEHGLIVLVVGSLGMAGCVAEAVRLGGARGLPLAAPLVAAGVGVVAPLAMGLGTGGRAVGWLYLDAAALALLGGGGALWISPRAPAVALQAVLGGAAALVLFLGVRGFEPGLAITAGLGGLFLALKPLALGGAETARRLLLLVLCALWLVPPLPATTEIWRLFGPSGLVALVLLSKIGDICGYYVGNAVGRRHPFPRLSPGKTVAGCVGSAVGGVLAGGLLVPLGLLPAGPLGIAGGLLAGLTVNLAAQTGDLVESAFKRYTGAKDSGPWFGPAGGVLDLLDSFLLSIPVALVTWPWILAEA